MIPSGLRRHRAFTLIEIMIVVSIVTILSWLAMMAIGRIKDRAARSLIENNLRQVYQAKEYYYSETGSTQLASFRTLITKGYLRSSAETIASRQTFEGHLGWNYALLYRPGSPVYAFRGEDPLVAQPDNSFAWRKTRGEIVWYPGPPEEAGAGTVSSGKPVTPPPLLPNPPVVVQSPTVVAQPPPMNVTPPVVVAQPPLTSTTVSPDVVQTPATTTQPPTVIAQPPTTTTVSPVVVQPATTPSTVNPAVNQGPTAANSGPANNPPGNQPRPNQSPGNSAHGHAQGQGQGHGNNKP